jgi:hypothetical protein
MPGGMPGGGMPGGMPGGGMPGGMMGGQRPGQGGDDVPGGGFRGGPGAGRGQPGQPNNQEPQSLVTVTQRGNALTIRVDVALKDASYEALRTEIQAHLTQVKGEAEMIGARQHWHDLGAALKRMVANNQNKFPMGAHKRRAGPERGGIPYPPDERVSWMRELLPGLPSKEYGNLYDAIASDESWRDAKNVGLASVLVSPFLNPFSERRYWWVPYSNLKKPVAGAHFVGIAGIGLDAADYSKDDKTVADKLGVFGYDRETAMEEIKKPENTIAILEVPYAEFQAPWMAGGGGTVRGVSEETGILPFVCESYKYKDGTSKAGTYAIMANGDVRFIPKDIKLDIFLKMCSITQAEKIDNLDDYCPLVPPPKEEKKALPPPPANNPPADKPAEAPKPATAANAKAVQALANNCAKCHTGERSKGKTMIFSSDGVLNPNAPKAEIAKALAEGKMPPKTEQRRPSADDLAAVNAWANAK